MAAPEFGTGAGAGVPGVAGGPPGAVPIGDAAEIGTVGACAPGLPLGGPLPELATVYWRRPMTVDRLRRDARLWTLATISHVLPFVLIAVALLVIEPLALPVALAALVHAWMIPELYAQRGANVVRPPPRPHRGGRPDAGAETRALGLLGDLVGHQARDGFASTGLLLERGRFGVWLLGECGALLLPGNGRRVHCFCVGVPEPELPRADRVAHLLLALRADEQGFATVANRAFCGARWRVRRRLGRRMRPALSAAAGVAAGRR